LKGFTATALSSDDDAAHGFWAHRDAHGKVVVHYQRAVDLHLKWYGVLGSGDEQDPGFEVFRTLPKGVPKTIGPDANLLHSKVQKHLNSKPIRTACQDNERLA
jgi:hypothetical protein